MRKVKVALYGVGAVGSLIANFLLEKQGVKIVGAIDVAKDKIGRDLGEILKLRRKLGVTISDDVGKAFSKSNPDIVVHATSSYLKDTYPQIATIVKHGVNVVSTCEELSYPYVTEPKLAKQLNALAKKHDATVLGTGINPGFLMDTLVIALTAPCQKVERIEVIRVMNASTRRLPFQRKIGAGLTIEDFKRKIEAKEITGHVGLKQSIAMIADALAWKLDKIVVEKVKPVIAERPTGSKDVRVGLGKVAGLRQKAKGVVRKKAVIALDFQAFIGAEEEYDAITISGFPNIRQKIQPCVHGDLGTIAMIVNAIPKVINAPAGLVTMRDLPILFATTKEMRKYILA